MGHSDPHIDFGQEYLRGCFEITVFLENFVYCKKTAFLSMGKKFQRHI